MAEREYDVVVIGAGPAGEIAAGRLAERGGRRVAIVERELIGGECSYRACMPSKALLRPQELFAEARRVPGVAEALPGHGLDATAVLDRRDEVIAHLDDSGHVPWLQERGIDVVRGQARLAGERLVSVGDDLLLRARDAVILAVGSGPLLPPIPGLSDAQAWTNREITTTREIPRRLIVLGGGVVGVEMAQAWRSLGSEVVILEAADRLLSREEPFAGSELAAEFGEQGIEVRTGVASTAVSRAGADTVVELEAGEAERGDRLLVAIGRRALTEDLGLETVGAEPGRQVQVDDRLLVSGTDWLYAIGDVNGRSLLTHMGKYQARVAADVIMGENVAATADGEGAPRVVFTSPQVAAVGKTLAAAREAGLNAKAIDLQTSATAGASFHGRNAPGTTRFVIDGDRDVIVGATFVGPEVAELLHAATIAVILKLPLPALAHAVPSFPTRSELWLKLIEAAGL